MGIIYKHFESKLGPMFPLISAKNDFSEKAQCLKFASIREFPKYASIDNCPIFFGKDGNFRIALTYTIIYPKVYVRRSAIVSPYDKISVAYIQ